VKGDIGANMFKHSPSQIFVPTIVVYELKVGIAKSNNPSKRMQQLEKLYISDKSNRIWY
jgi:tRNA(fMet)-specific endonuclease VapC